LSHKFDYYFPEDPRSGNLRILNPFAVNSAAEEGALSAELKDKLIEVSEDSNVKL